MKSIRPDDPNFPIDMDRFINCIKEIVEPVTLADIPEEGVLYREHIIADYAKTIQDNGFSVLLEFKINDKSEIDVLIEDVIFYDSMDEWLDALSRVNKMKKS